MSDEQELKPCPFCGGGDLIREGNCDGDYAQTVCDTCQSCGPFIDRVGGYWKVTESWNHRPVEDALKQEVEKWKNLITNANRLTEVQRERDSRHRDIEDALNARIEELEGLLVEATDYKDRMLTICAYQWKDEVKSLEARLVEAKRENLRQRVELHRLWSLLDDIDTAGDMYKPKIDGYFKYVQKKSESRVEGGITSDGYDLFKDGKKLIEQGVGDTQRRRP